MVQVCRAVSWPPSAAEQKECRHHAGAGRVEGEARPKGPRHPPLGAVPHHGGPGGTIDTLAPDDCYDLVFVTLQAGQLPDVLPILKQNRSEYFVFVGNDPHAVEVMQAMQRPADKIAFGFQSSGGHRDVDKVVSAHVGVDMTIGGATAPLSGVFRYRVKTAFEGAKLQADLRQRHGRMAQVPPRPHPAGLLSLLRLQRRSLQGDEGAA